MGMVQDREGRYGIGMVWDRWRWFRIGVDGYRDVRIVRDKWGG